MILDRERAGRSSQQKYNELVRSWRRRNRRLFVVIGLCCTAIVMASAAAGVAWPHQRWAWGFVAGVAFCFFVISRLSAPGWIENWQQGAWGEQATAKELQALVRSGWVVLHDLPAGRGNVDHIVVGAGGVFLLDSKRLGGAVRVEPDLMVVSRLDDPDLTYRHPGTPHLLSLARETHDRVLHRLRLRIWVNPVMVLWAEFPQGVSEGRCNYVHGKALVPWLLARPQVIAPHRVEQVAGAVRDAWMEQATTA